MSLSRRRFVALMASFSPLLSTLTAKGSYAGSVHGGPPQPPDIPRYTADELAGLAEGARAQDANLDSEGRSWWASAVVTGEGLVEVYLDGVISYPGMPGSRVADSVQWRSRNSVAGMFRVGPDIFDGASEAEVLDAFSRAYDSIISMKLYRPVASMNAPVIEPTLRVIRLGPTWSSGEFRVVFVNW